MEQAYPLRRDVRINIGRNSIGKPVAVCSRVNQQENETGHCRKRNGPDDCSSRLAQEQEQEYGGHGSIGQLFRVASEQQQHHYHQKALIIAPPGPLFPFYHNRDQNNGKGLEHDHKHVLAKQWPDMIDVIGGQKSKTGKE